MLFSANLSTIIIAAIFAPSLCSASSKMSYTISKIFAVASLPFKHSTANLFKVSTPSAYTYSSEFIISFAIRGNTDSVHNLRASDRFSSFSEQLSNFEKR